MKSIEIENLGVLIKIYLHDIQVDWCKHELIQYNIFIEKHQIPFIQPKLSIVLSKILYNL